jgi:pyrimidine-nucleoside phosphorylase
MISGRGLGHTGGTLDKLESIPGFRTDLSIDEYKRVIRQIGLVMVGQTSQLTPADKRMYALRDVTATIECIPLIAGSIMSKKLAGGTDALVLDIKTGRGAFMRTNRRAVELAETLVKIGSGFGKETIAFITDMNQPLGASIGNWLEIVEAVECLRGMRGQGDHSADLMTVTHVLAGAMLMLGRKVRTIAEGVEQSKRAIKDGSAYRTFLKLVPAHGGDLSVVENLEEYPLPKHIIEVRTTGSGYVGEIDPVELGLTGIQLGAGRARIGDAIDPKAGILLRKKIGDAVKEGDVLAVLQTDKEEAVDAAHTRIQKAFVIQRHLPKQRPLVLNYVDRGGVKTWM